MTQREFNAAVRYALEGHPEGLSRPGLLTRILTTRPGQRGDADAWLSDLVRRDAAWRLPLTTHDGRETTLYFVPHPAELARHQAGKERRA